jgi:hypothetical protein
VLPAVGKIQVPSDLLERRQQLGYLNPFHPLRLFVLLALELLLPYSFPDQAGVGTRMILGEGWLGLPVLFSGIIFFSSLKSFGNVVDVLGINMFGAVCGGVLENAMMLDGRLVGSPSLYTHYQRFPCYSPAEAGQSENRGRPGCSSNVRRNGTWREQNYHSIWA